MFSCVSKTSSAAKIRSLRVSSLSTSEGKDGKIKKHAVQKEFSQWYYTNFGKKVPRVQEISDYMNQRFCKFKSASSWIGLAIIYDDEDEDLIDEC